MNLLSDREAATLLGCGRSTVWRWAANGTIQKPLKIGGMSRWPKSEIEAVIDRAKAQRKTEGDGGEEESDASAS